MEDWSDHAPRTRWGSWRSINAGWYGIRVWFYENTGGAVARLRYEGPGVAAQIVPSASLRTCSPACAATEPTNPSVTNLTATSAQLNWTSGTGGDKQLLRLDTSQSEVENGCPTGCLIKEDNLDKDLQLYNTGSVLEPGTRYYWRVVEYKDATCWADFATTPSFVTKADPWTKVDGGDIHANSQITFSREVPSGEYNGLYIISSQSTLGSNVKSDKDWLVSLYPEGDFTPSNNSGIDAPDYDTLWTRFGQGQATTYTGVSLPTGNGVYLINGNHTLSSVVNISGGADTLIFVNGDFTIDAEIRVPANASLAVVASGRIRIRKNLTGGGAEDSLAGIYIAQSDINTAYNIGAPPDTSRKLNVDGALVSLGSTIYLNRNLGDTDNGTTPAEEIIFNPKSFVLLKSRLANPKVFWKEVAP